MIKAVYPGTFDPLTRGHEDLVRRASTLFDTLVLAVAESTAKRTFFTLEERVAMAKEVLGDVKNLEIVGFRGLLTKFVRQHVGGSERHDADGRRPQNRLLQMPLEHGSSHADGCAGGAAADAHSYQTPAKMLNVRWQCSRRSRFRPS